MNKKLYRSETDMMLGGVCGGLAEYLDTDSTVIRLLFVLLGLGTGSGLLIYIVLWIIVPKESNVDMDNSEIIHKNTEEVKEKAQEVVEKVKTETSSDTKKKN